MIKHYECLNCQRINNIGIIELRDRQSPLYGRLICGHCGSFNVCRIHPMSDKRLLINSDLVAINKHPDIDAITEEGRKLEEIFLRSDKLTIKLIDIYLERNGLIDSLEMMLVPTEDNDILLIRMLKSNNEKLFNLIEEIKTINILTQR
ncbi:hypothetical protein [Aphanothece sacrum]|uniref:Uncharacterized protein n=1 Tax=Aphanothece sacrum FPU1 TaxID=1920663 RepID=A0A401IEJ8_APHSA|nr:hypothetical protein [Aphanothece sacrum]GBF79707.1 hypothetical protein AsFPU1_1106 [Aphanothece sacrum FPU1]GBF87169.1 hypothetical protein AsFPU3_4251 [Aphanothece sacrum FPU3]